MLQTNEYLVLTKQNEVWKDKDNTEYEYISFPENFFVNTTSSEIYFIADIISDDEVIISTKEYARCL